MKYIFTFALFFAFIVIVKSLTCRAYDNNKCIAVGCDFHCQTLGKHSGYCRRTGSYCTCFCVRFDKTGAIDYMKSYNETEKEYTFCKSCYRSGQPCCCNGPTCQCGLCDK